VLKKPSVQQNKLNWEVILVIAFYVILPTYFAVEISQAIPLITASRVLLLLMAGMMVLRNRNQILHLRNLGIRQLNLGLAKDKFLSWGICIYFVVLLVVNLTFILDTSEALKQIFVMAAEEYALVWLLLLVLDSRKKLVVAIEVFAIASGVTGLLAALGCILDQNLFHFLDTVSRELTQVTYYRLGLLRAAAGFGHPVYYGSFCAVMVPLCMFLVEQQENPKKRLLFSACLVMNFVGVVFANSRGSILALGCTAVLVFCIRLASKSLKKLFQTYIPIFAAAAAVMLLVAVLSPAGISFLGNTIKSVIQSIIPYNPDSGLLEGNDIIEDLLNQNEGALQPEYGENANGLSSRFVQLTGIGYTLSQNPWFGMGPNAFARGLVAYTFVEGHLSFVKTVDVNIVAIIGQYGLVGLIAFLALYGSIGITLVRKKYRQDPLMHYLFLSFVCYMLCLLSISFLDKWFWIFVAFVVSLVNIIGKEQMQGKEPPA